MLEASKWQAMDCDIAYVAVNWQKRISKTEMPTLATQAQSEIGNSDPFLKTNGTEAFAKDSFLNASYQYLFY